MKSAASKPGGKPKLVTKLSAAKKVLNKRVKVNVRKVFDEDGEVAQVASNRSFQQELKHIFTFLSG